MSKNLCSGFVIHAFDAPPFVEYEEYSEDDWHIMSENNDCFEIQRKRPREKDCHKICGINTVYKDEKIAKKVLVKFLSWNLMHLEGAYEQAKGNLIKAIKELNNGNDL